MEQLFLRFPHLSEAICGQLNNESLATWTGVSRSLNMYLTEQKLFEVRIIKATIKKYHKRRYCGVMGPYDRTRWASNAWKEVFKTASKETLMNLRHEVQKFYSNMNHQIMRFGEPHGYHQIRLNKDITPLHLAAIAGNELLFKTLFNKAQDKHPRCEDVQTPLHYAAYYGYLEICAFIMAQSEDKNPKSESGETPLHLAASEGYLNICEYITERVKDKNPADNNKWTPLHLAADRGHAEVCDYIIQQVDEKNPRNDDEMTPLHLAAQEGDYTVYEIIMSNGGDPNLEDEYGKTPAIYLRNQALLWNLNF